MEYNEELVENIFQVSHSYYLNYLNQLYPKAKEENKEAFLLTDPSLVDAYLVYDHSNLLNFNTYFLLFQGNGRRKMLHFDESKRSDVGSFSNDLEFLNSYIQTNYDSENLIYSDHLGVNTLQHYKTYNEWLQNRLPLIDGNMKRLVKIHAQSFIKHIDKPASYYAKYAYKYVYSELDFEQIIKIISDEDFEFALNESLAAYDHSLYLAASSTAGTALENLIVVILERNGIKIDDNQITELGYLTGLLTKNNIIDRRMKQRIKTAANFRNLASHANKGRTIREDAKMIYSTINTLATESFNI